MNILLLEPFSTGSHKYFCESLVNYSTHEIDLLEMPGKNWKWRMHGGAVELSRQFLDSQKEYDLILASDMCDLGLFISLGREKFSKSTKFATYFHESQFSYPWSDQDHVPRQNRDLHFSFINYTNALVSDFNIFNSKFHFDSFFKDLEAFLRKMPDFKGVGTISSIRKKSFVLEVGIDPRFKSNPKSDTDESDVLKILWNHRWEYDKNPEDFFKVLFKIKDQGLPFELITLGYNSGRIPEIFPQAKEKLADEIIQWGPVATIEEYLHWLSRADILPVTSLHDYFGISTVEAVLSGAKPILPKRMNYPYLVKKEHHSQYLYDNLEDLEQKITQAIKDKNRGQAKLEHFHTNDLFWPDIIKKYDELFSQHDL
ncbi:MAG: DUF3524 domain-containing protein [Bacteriovoracaceae bacterium]|jgi:glycosyltransferase involved in cell wall biosynthesis|nr:DUF3524 domain-containing protein [Bacteriovoracaceae bacterium]